MKKVDVTEVGVKINRISLPPFLSNFAGLFKGFFPQPAEAGRPAEAFGLKQLNQILLVTVILIVAYLAFDVTGGLKISQKELEFKVEPADMGQSAGFLPQLRELAEYISTVAERNIFHPFEAKKVEEKITPEEEKVVKISEKTSTLKLVGISWLDTPESASAMIENSTTSVTHFLKIGDKINDVTVKMIYADTIILTFEDEEMEMKL
jgi:hypothetical protein